MSNIQQLLPTLDQRTIDRIANRLEEYRIGLVALAEAGRIADITDRDNILRYLRDGCLPVRLSSVTDITRHFVSSALSYHVIRRILARHVGSIPTYATIAQALALEFTEPQFLDETSWTPRALQQLAMTLAKRLGIQAHQLGHKTPTSRMLGVLHDGGRALENELESGINAYYDTICAHLISPESAWRMLEIRARPISQVGAPLLADFMKNIGFHQFVKPDVHFLREIPQLADLSEKLRDRDSFIFGWRLAERIGMPAFLLDHILYQWGRNGNNQRLFSSSTALQVPALPVLALTPPTSQPGLTTDTQSKVASTTPSLKSKTIISRDQLLDALKTAAATGDIADYRVFNDGKHLKYRYREDPNSSRERFAIMFKVGAQQISIHLSAYPTKSEIESLAARVGLSFARIEEDENPKDQFDWKVILDIDDFEACSAQLEFAATFVGEAIKRYKA